MNKISASLILQTIIIFEISVCGIFGDKERDADRQKLDAFK